jgi:hypothetical protein
MPVPSLFSSLSTTPGTNVASISGSDSPIVLDDHLRTVYAFLASVYANSGNGWASPYLTVVDPAFTGTLTGQAVNVSGTINNVGASFSGSAAAGALTLDASGNLGIGTGSPAARIDVSGGQGNQIAVSGTNTNTSYSSLSAWGDDSNGGKGTWGANAFSATLYSSNLTRHNTANSGWGITGSVATSAYEGGSSLAFSYVSAAGVTLERMRLDVDGALLVGRTGASSAPDTGFNVAGTGGQTYIATGHINGTPGGFPYSVFAYNGGSIGSITQNGTTTVLYNTTSDHRLKGNQQPLSGSAQFIDALRPTSWAWIADGTPGAGFIAHEFQAVSPGSVSGTKDAVDEDGKPVYQAMQASSAEVTANIVAELQSLRLRVAAIESK